METLDFDGGDLRSADRAKRNVLPSGAVGRRGLVVIATSRRAPVRNFMAVAAGSRGAFVLVVDERPAVHGAVASLILRFREVVNLGEQGRQLHGLPASPVIVQEVVVFRAYRAQGGEEHHGGRGRQVRIQGVIAVQLDVERFRHVTAQGPDWGVIHDSLALWKIFDDHVQPNWLGPAQDHFEVLANEDNFNSTFFLILIFSSNCWLNNPTIFNERKQEWGLGSERISKAS